MTPSSKRLDDSHPSNLQPIRPGSTWMLSCLLKKKTLSDIYYVDVTRWLFKKPDDRRRRRHSLILLAVTPQLARLGARKLVFAIRGNFPEVEQMINVYIYMGVGSLTTVIWTVAIRTCTVRRFSESNTWWGRSNAFCTMFFTVRRRTHTREAYISGFINVRYAPWWLFVENLGVRSNPF